MLNVNDLKRSQAPEPLSPSAHPDCSRPACEGMQSDNASASLAAWRAAHISYSLGRLEESSSHTARGARLGATGSLLSHAHSANLFALSRQLSAPYAPSVSSICTPESLFAREISLTVCYNIGLSHARSGHVVEACRALDGATSLLALPPSPVTLAAHGRSVLAAATPIALLRRVAAVATALLQLRAALELLQGRSNEALAANRSAAVWLHADAMLIVPGERCAAADTETEGRDERAEVRGACVESLALATANDLRGAARALEPIARTASVSGKGEDRGMAAVWMPALYQCGALRTLAAVQDERVVQDSEHGTKWMLERCARAGHRAADAHALLARMERAPGNALRSFQAALAVEHTRPATLVAAAAAFENAGRYNAQVEILSCLADLPLQIEGSRKCGTLSIVEPWKKDEDKVAVARARALVLAKRPEEAMKILDDMTCGRDTDETRLRVAAVARAALGDVNAANTAAVVFGKKYPFSVSAQLAIADASLCAGKVYEAQSALDKASKIALRSEIHDEDAETSAVRTLLRGTCYNNRGVLLMCGVGGPGNEDGMFAAAQVAFDKAGDKQGVGMKVREWASAAGETASWNRVLAMAAGGRITDAASHWIARRGERGKREGKRKGEKGFGKPVSHVMGIVDEGRKVSMDEMCEGIERAERSQRLLAEAVREAVDNW